MTLVTNTCPTCGSDDVTLPDDDDRWFCFGCEARWTATPTPAERRTVVVNGWVHHQVRCSDDSWWNLRVERQ